MKATPYRDRLLRRGTDRLPGAAAGQRRMRRAISCSTPAAHPPTSPSPSRASGARALRRHARAGHVRRFPASQPAARPASDTALCVAPTSAQDRTGLRRARCGRRTQLQFLSAAGRRPAVPRGRISTAACFDGRGRVPRLLQQPDRSGHRREHAGRHAPARDSRRTGEHGPQPAPVAVAGTTSIRRHGCGRRWLEADLVKLCRGELEFLAAPPAAAEAVLQRLCARAARSACWSPTAPRRSAGSRACSGASRRRFRVTAVDTTAAGDAFVGGLLLPAGRPRRRRRRNLAGLPRRPRRHRRRAYDTPPRVGALATTRHGAFAAMPTRARGRAH